MTTAQPPQNPPSKPVLTSAPQVERLANLLTLQKRFRHAASVESLQYLLVNEARVIALYRNAVLWRNGEVTAVAGLPAPVKEAPFTLWVRDVLRHLSTTTPQERTLTAADLPEALQKDWNEYLPAFALWLPMGEESGLLLAREKAFLPAEMELLKHTSDAAAHALTSLEKTTPRIGALVQARLRPYLQDRRRLKRIGIGLLVFLLFPVRLSVVAPAEVTAQDAFVVRAPLTGVIRSIDATPNSQVKEGDLLLMLDDQEWQGKLHIAEQALAVARSEYINAQQAAITNPEAQATLNILAGRLEQRQAELTQIEDVLGRITITTDREGIALIPDRDALQGKPVQIGEKIMTVANAGNAQIEAWIPIADSIDLPADARLDFYLNTAPGSAIRAEVQNVSYQASLSPAGILAFRATARITDEDLPRLGLHGTAKLYGGFVPLSYYLLRKPLTVVSKWLGW